MKPKSRTRFSASWWSGNQISVFCLQRVALYFKAMPNSIVFYKGIFLHVIPVCIIVPSLEIIILYNSFESSFSRLSKRLFFIKWRFK